MKLLLLLLAFTMPTHADQLSTDKTKRMVAIEQHFNVRMVGVFRTKDRDYWVFLEAAPGQAAMKYFPVVIPENGTDHDMTVARTAAENVAAYFEVELRDKEKANPSPTPSPTSVFTMPTHPPQEVVEE